MKLLQTQDYLLLIDEEAEIKYGNYYYHSLQPNSIFKAEMYKPFKNASKSTIGQCAKIIAYHPLTEEAKELDLPLLLNPFEEVDIEKLAKEHGDLYINQREKELGYLSFCEGYKAAQSKQLELLKRAIQLASDAENIEEVTEEIIQSLSTQRMPSEFIPEYEYQLIDGTWCWLLNTRKESVLKNNLPIRLKTITNSEGKQELVGVYKY